MDIATSLYKGKLICLGPIDHEKDAVIEARWTQDAEYLRLVATKPAVPLSVAQVQKYYESLEKEMEEGKNSFYFTIRTLPMGAAPADRLVGFITIEFIEWNHGNGWIVLGIGDANDRGKGYGSEALRLMLHYAFAELNLYRVTTAVPEYCPAALHLFEKAGFVREVCRRQALNRDGRYWDLFHLGLLRAEWEKR